MRIEVASAGPREETLVAIDVRPGATVEDAVINALPALLDSVRRGELRCAIFGRRVDLATRLADGDRVEITRPLVCDPGLARRRRAARTR